MADKARSMWEKFITAPRNAALLKRYAKSAKEPSPLFDSIGEDLASSNKAVRATAFWALVAATPELINILHETETRQPGWREIEGKDQQMVNRGMDIVSKLHRALVEKHGFKIDKGKDPRPYVNKAMKNMNWDKGRKRRNKDGDLREVPLDYEASLEIPDDAGSPEDYIIETETYDYDSLWQEYETLFRDRDTFDVFIAHHVDDRPLEEIRERLGVSSDVNVRNVNVRKQKSRINKKMVARRDALYSQFLFAGDEFVKKGKFPRSARYPERFEKWAKLAKQSIQPGAWMNGKAADGKKAFAVRALTRGLHNAPGHIYLLAVHKDYYRALYYEIWPLPGHGPPIEVVLDGGCQLLNDESGLDSSLRDATEMIDSTMGLHQSRYMLCRLDAYPTELPSLNKALAEVLDAYNVWLISNSIILRQESDVFPPWMLALPRRFRLRRRRWRYLDLDHIPIERKTTFFPLIGL
jgi:DNA-directed RNA polymerase specialized sigma24 family protein